MKIKIGSFVRLPEVGMWLLVVDYLGGGSYSLRCPDGSKVIMALGSGLDSIQ